jgi:hypothetical protein
MEDGPAPPYVVHCDGMPEGVNGPSRGLDAELSTKQFAIPKHIPTPEPLTLPSREDEIPLAKLTPAVEMPP